MEKVTEMKSKAPKGFDFQYKAFENLPAFVEMAQKFYTCKNFPTFQQAHRIKRLVDALQKELNTYLDFRRDIDKMTDDKEKKAKLEELHKTVVKMKWDAVTEEEINCLGGVSPQNVAALEFIAEPSCFQ